MLNEISMDKANFFTFFQSILRLIINLKFWAYLTRAVNPTTFILRFMEILKKKLNHNYDYTVSLHSMSLGFYNFNL